MVNCQISRIEHPLADHLVKMGRGAFRSVGKSLLPINYGVFLEQGWLGKIPLHPFDEFSHLRFAIESVHTIHDQFPKPEDPVADHDPHSGCHRFKDREVSVAEQSGENHDVALLVHAGKIVPGPDPREELDRVNNPPLRDQTPTFLQLFPRGIHLQS